MAECVTFLCTANICRSPWAELRARQLLTGLEVRSSGTLASSGNHMDPVMAATLTGADTHRHRSRPLTRRLIDSSSLILCMERTHRDFVLEEWPKAFRRTFTLGTFVRIIEQVPARLDFTDLVEWAFDNRQPDLQANDVADPYRQGPEVARRCARQLESMLQTLCVRLDAAAARDVLPVAPLSHTEPTEGNHV